VSRKFVRRGVKLGAIVGAVFFLAQVFLRKQAPKRGDSTTRTVPPPKLTNATPQSSSPLNGTDIGATDKPATEAPSKVAAPDEAQPWVDPVDGACPPTHPIKAKLSSKIFHAPGGLAYDRTTPDRCYRDAASAEADGFRQAKR
jgi:hypothetical protein